MNELLPFVGLGVLVVVVGVILHSKLTAVHATAQATHAAALAPVTIATIQQAAPPPAPATAPTVTDLLFPGHGGGESAAPTQPAPTTEPAPAPADPNAWPGPAVPVSGAVPMSWAMFPLYLNGNTSITVTPDTGWKGAVRFVFSVRPGTVYPYTTTLNGACPKTAETDGIIDYWVRVGGPAQNPQEIVVDGSITAAVTQAGGVTCAFYAYPQT